jgi:hypothetical protein
MEIEISPIQLSRGRVITSRVLSALMGLAAVGIVIVYAMNIWCVASDPTRPMLTGGIFYQSFEGPDTLPSVLSGKSGMDRAFVEAVPKDQTGYVTLGGTRIALANMAIGAWVAYLIFLTLCLSVGLLFLISLARLFYGFSRGRIFTKDSIRQIKRTGFAVLLGGALQFLAGFFAMWINAAAGYQDGTLGQVFGTTMQVPVGPIICAVMIILTALMFEEGRKLSEEASLTI